MRQASGMEWSIRALAGVLLSLTSLFAASPEWESQGPGVRFQVLPQLAGKSIGFTSIGSELSHILFTNALSQDRFTTHQILLNGSGVTAGDVDGDGWCDLYFCSLSGSNRLYRNLGGWKFEDISSKAGAACETQDATGAAFVDLDGDGDLDLIVNSIGRGTRFFVNDGLAHFREHQWVNEGKAGMSLAVGDLDGDGRLDVYVCNYRTTTLRDMPRTTFKAKNIGGKPVVTQVNGKPADSPEFEGRFSISMTGGIVEHGESDLLLHQESNGKFSPISFTGGAFTDEDGRPIAKPLYDWGLSVMMHDLNGDGAPDIYVCNDFDSEDRIWINNGHGGFRAAPQLAFRSTSKFSMGIDIADVNRDGFDDLLVLDMMSPSHATRMTRADKNIDPNPMGILDNRPQLPRNTFQWNRGDGTFAEIAWFLHLEASGWSWTPAFLDVDLDGYEDVLVTTGHGRDDMDSDTGQRIESLKRSARMTPLEELNLRRQTPPLLQPQRAFHNIRGERFEEIGEAWGFGDRGIGHGMCLADLDNDGDLDVIVNHLNGPAGLYRNNATAPRVGVRLHGLGANSRGIGSKVMLRGGAVPMQSQEVICGGRYLSSDDPMRVFAAGTSNQPMRLEVTWRSGKRSIVEPVFPNRIYEISEANALPPPVSSPASPAPALFEDVSALLSHVHHEDPFDDFDRQPLLPNRLSQLGPGVCWMDLNSDGLEDLVIGSGKGGRLAAFQNLGTKGFLRLTNAPWDTLLIRDQTALVVCPSPDSTLALLTGSASYEEPMVSSSSVVQWNPQRPVEAIPDQPCSAGPLALADIDGDGDLDLFVGGRVMPGRYPQSATSSLWRREPSGWVLDAANSDRVKDVGLVSGAVWTDLDGDGWPELVLACEWGPLRIFSNHHGQLEESTQGWGLDRWTGWWNGVTAGDFDGDGRMDLAASNWGLNSKYRATEEHPRRIYFADFMGDAHIHLLESYWDPELSKWVPERDLNAVSKALPFVRETFPLHRVYAQAGIADILGDRISSTHQRDVNTLETSVWLNRGNHFERGRLPASAQWSPAFGLSVADFDGDGNEDLFVSQNFFAVQPQTSRNDAGRGMMMLGDGKGKFREVGGDRSGILVYGEQRGCAIADYDGDGRVDLVVTQNAAQTRLFHNRGAKPGIRVRLQGTPANPKGVGAVVRLKFADRWGPARELHDGSGYWSTDSSVLVLATPSAPTHIQVRWPSGSLSYHPIPKNTLELLLSFSTDSLSPIR